ncbi:hypothetical protein D9615_009045 [Tricholomella constricta]|uniref:DUF6593 domain-containing protein n=1 Tax=Tricholomella constricta TaxID=117010 RepID=A0A8H5H0C4_9AGAR|nr:hypothetical protein D9615_009045 [Tricholomella constricta]
MSNAYPYLHALARSSNSIPGSLSICNKSTSFEAPPSSLPLQAPYPTRLPSLHRPSYVTFSFMGLSPDITNCTVFGPRFATYYNILTNPSTPGFTVIQDMNERNVAAIGWKQPAFVEISEMVTRQKTRQWLRLSPNGTYRTMEVRGVRYFWVSRESVISLYSRSSSSDEPIARTTEKDGIFVLDIMPDVLQAGLLELCVVATVLLESHHDIDHD